MASLLAPIPTALGHQRTPDPANAGRRYRDCLELGREVAGIVVRGESDKPAALSAFPGRHPVLSLVAEDDTRIIGKVLSVRDRRRAHVHHLVLWTILRPTHCAIALFNASLQAIRWESIAHGHTYVRTRNLTA